MTYYQLQFFLRYKKCWHRPASDHIWSQIFESFHPLDRQVIKYDHFKISSLPQKYEEFWKNLLSKNILENDVFSRFEVKNVNFCIFLQVPGKGLNLNDLNSVTNGFVDGMP